MLISLSECDHESVAATINFLSLIYSSFLLGHLSRIIIKHRAKVKSCYVCTFYTSCFRTLRPSRPGAGPCPVALQRSRAANAASWLPPAPELLQPPPAPTAARRVPPRASCEPCRSHARFCRPHRASLSSLESHLHVMLHQSCFSNHGHNQKFISRVFSPVPSLIFLLSLFPPFHLFLPFFPALKWQDLWTAVSSPGEENHINPGHKRIFGLFRARKHVWWLQMSYFS